MKRAFIYFFYYNLVVATLLLVGYFALNSKVRGLDSSRESLTTIVASLDEEVGLLREAQERDTQATQNMINELSLEIASLDGESTEQTEVLGSFSLGGQVSLEDDRSPVLGTVTIQDRGWDKVDIHIKPLASSAVVGQAFSDLTYLYVAREDGWYQIDLGDGDVGWIQASLVVEN